MKNSTKIKFIAQIILLFVATKTIAACPATHVYLAQKWANAREHFNEQEEASFIRGTLFPDIRHLGVISRQKTHYKELTLQKLLSCNDDTPFSKGVKIHSFVDEAREQFVNKSNIYSQLKDVPGQEYLVTFLKLLEDEVLYHRKKNFPKIIDALSFIDNSEMAYKIKKEDVLIWHKILNTYFSMAPSKYLIEQIKSKKNYFDIPDKTLEEWSKMLPILSKRQDIRNYVDNLIKQFDIVWKIQKTTEL